MNLVPNFNTPYDDHKKQQEEMIERAKENMRNMEQQFASNSGNSIVDMMENNAKQQERSANSLEKIAENAKIQADSAKILAEKAKEDSLKAKKRVNWSIFFTALSCIGTLIANSDKIYTNVLKILSHLGMIK